MQIETSPCPPNFQCSPTCPEKNDCPLFLKKAGRISLYGNKESHQLFIDFIKPS